jgi:hypothetical protein
MKKKFVISVLSVSFVLTCLTVPVFAEKAAEKTKNDTQTVARYQKFFGQKKGVVGKDSSAQSTAGVAGGAQEGLKAKDHDASKVDESKSELYKGSPVNVIKKLIKPKKAKTGK